MDDRVLIHVISKVWLHSLQLKRNLIQQHSLNQVPTVTGASKVEASDAKWASPECDAKRPSSIFCVTRLICCSDTDTALLH